MMLHQMKTTGALIAVIYVSVQNVTQIWIKVLTVYSQYSYSNVITMC